MGQTQTVSTNTTKERPMNTQLKTILAKKITKKGEKNNGFTLIELMVVVAIVGVLTAIGLPQLTAAQNKAKVAAAEQELSNAAKECSVELLTDGTVPTFGATGAGAGVVIGTCAAGQTLSYTPDYTGAAAVTVLIDAQGIPGN